MQDTSLQTIKTSNQNGDFSYSFSSEGLKFISNSNKTVFTPWSEITELKPVYSKRHSLEFKTLKSGRIPIVIDKTNEKDFLNSFFKQIKTNSAYTYQKLLFHYCSKENAMQWVWFSLSIVLLGGISVVFLVDAFNTSKCDRAFEQGLMTSTAEVKKVKKDRKGGYSWDLTFTTADGTLISGKRYAFLHDPQGYPLSKNPMVVYASSNNTCWEISTSQDKPVIPKAQRWFTNHLNYGFGTFFAILSIVFSFLSLRKLTEKKPYYDQLNSLGL